MREVRCSLFSPEHKDFVIRRMKKNCLAFTCFIILAVLAGCERMITPAMEQEMEAMGNNSEAVFAEQGERIPIHIIAGDDVIEAELYENGTAQTFARLLPLTVNLWTPIHYAQAFDLPIRIPDQDERTRVYEQGTIGYWYEGPSIALLHAPDELETAVPIVKIGKMLSNYEILETYRDSVTIERSDAG